MVVITLNWAHSVVVGLFGNVSYNIGNVTVWNTFLAGLSRNGGSTNISVDPLGPPIFSSFHSDPRTVSEQLPEIMW